MRNGSRGGRWMAGAAAVVSAVVGLPGVAWGQWTPVERGPEAAEGEIRPLRYQVFDLDLAGIRAALATAPMEDLVNSPKGVEIALPGPDGALMVFEMVESPIMEPALAALHPDIRTYAGVGLDDPTASVRIDVSDRGVHGIVLSEHGPWTIAPLRRGDAVLHKAVGVRAWGARTFTCQVMDNEVDDQPAGGGGPAEARVGPTRREFRVAVAATGEFTANNGGTAASAQAQVVSLMNQVAAVYEREIATRLTLIGTNQNLMSVDAATDPWDNSSTIALLNAAPTNINAGVGSGSYDIGHVFGWQSFGSGVASLAVLCTTNKARGVSIISPPVTDAFNIFLIAHEMGHQFGAEHTFNGTATGNCSSNRSSSSAFEPGSGSTIMSYAGICGSDNIVTVGDLYFHVHSFDQMLGHLSSRTCDVEVATGNIAPTVSAGPDRAIPARTPFVLTAVGSDANGDPLVYRWEQFDLAASGQPLTAGDLGNNPIIRSRPATSSPERTVPPIANVLSPGLSLPPGELLPQVARVLDFRVTALDNRVGGGGRNDDAVAYTVVGTAGPFRVTSPNTNVTWSGIRNVTWDVAGTNAAPISTANVRILLSTDGGSTFPTVLAASTPNDGSEPVTLPQITTATARIRIEAVDNIYFDVSDTNFRLQPGPAVGFALVSFAINDTGGTGNGNGILEPGETGVVLTPVIRNFGSDAATNAFGSLSTSTATASVTSALSSFGNMPPDTTAEPLFPFVLDVSEAHPCGEPVQLRLAVGASGVPSTNLDFSIPTGSSGGAFGPSTFSYTGPAVAIPAGATGGGTPVEVPFEVSGLTGSISDVDFRFDTQSGVACTSAANSTTVGLTHNFIGDLVITLISPQGTSVVLAERLGGVNNGGNHLCNTTFDDGATNAIQSATSGQAPYSGSWIPRSPLNAFNGQSPNGTWRLRVQDFITADSGTIRRFSLIVRGNNPPVCAPPVACPCPADYDQSGSPIPDIDDIVAFFRDFNEGDGTSTDGDPSADVDCTGAGSIPDIDDIIRFFEVFSSGC